MQITHWICVNNEKNVLDKKWSFSVINTELDFVEIRGLIGLPKTCESQSRQIEKDAYGK